MKKNFTLAILVFAAIFAGFLSVSAQMKTRKNEKKTEEKTTVQSTDYSAADLETKAPTKKNGRPEVSGNDSRTQELQKKNQSPKTNQSAAGAKKSEPKNVFFYEFKQPDFVVSHIVIEHDENGKGSITFEKKSFGGESVTDEIQLSAASLEKINNLFQTLNFIDSTEDYQSTLRQYPHLGTMKIALKKDGRERATEFNWTENKDAKALADEYRRIAEQFVWMFDISVSVQNQPLEAPSLMTRLDSLLKRNEISDPVQMVPLLKRLADDERIPLIARNHATRMVKDIEKNKSK